MSLETETRVAFGDENIYIYIYMMENAGFALHFDQQSCKAGVCMCCLWIF